MGELRPFILLAALAAVFATGCSEDRSSGRNDEAVLKIPGVKKDNHAEMGNAGPDARGELNITINKPEFEKTRVQPEIVKPEPKGSALDF